MKLRWLRIVIPLAVVLALMVGTGIVHAVLEPDTSEAAYLSPERHEPTSAGELAERLRAKGITIRRETRSSDALMSTWKAAGEATLFIPAPEFVHPDYLWMLRLSPAKTRVVLVEPGVRQVFEAVPTLKKGSTRWATAVTEPGVGCTLTTAGAAAVTRTRYSGGFAAECYDHGLVSAHLDGIEFVVAGSADPFRSDRLSEHDNATLAVDLLGARKTLVWLDLHALEPNPKTYSEDPPGAGGPIPSLAPGRERPRPDASPHPAPSDEAGGELDIDWGSAPPPSPFPPWLVPTILMFLLVGLALALARGRRLGAPVTEPLPIDVPGAETAIGRGRLYRRAKARGATVEILRIEARRRIAEALKVPNDKESILSVRPQYEDLLYGPAPKDDEQMVRAIEELLKEIPR